MNPILAAALAMFPDALNVDMPKPTAPSGATEDDVMRDVRGIYNAVVVLADAGRLDLAQEVFDLADEQRVPVEIKGGTHLARLAAEDAIEQAIAKARSGS